MYNSLLIILGVALAFSIIGLMVYVSRSSRLKEQLRQVEDNLHDSTNRLLTLENQLQHLNEQRAADKDEYNEQLTDYHALKSLHKHLELELESTKKELAATQKSNSDFLTQANNAQGLVSVADLKVRTLEQNLQQQQEEFKLQNQDLRQQFDNQLKHTREQHQREIAQLEQAHTKELETLKQHQAQQLLQQQETTAKQLKFIEEQTKANLQILREEVQNSTSELVKGTTQKFFNDSVEKINLITNPLKEKMTELTQGARELLEKNLKTDAQFFEKINSFDKQIAYINENATNLANALRGSNKKALGNWGEQQLEVTLESLGLVKGLHYQMQAVFKRPGKEQNLIPDCVLNLPHERKIVIDSKASLNAYLKAYQAQTKDEENAAISELIKNIETHVKQLSSKAYQNIPELNSPEFVIMYIPIDNVLAYISAAKPELFAQALKQNVVIVSNSTLIPLLAMVDRLWKNHEFSNNVHKLASNADKFFDAVMRVARSAISLGNNLQQINGSYNDLVKSLGNTQGAIRQIERFNVQAAKALEELDKVNKLEVDKDEAPALKLASFVSENLVNSVTTKQEQSEQIIEREIEKEIEPQVESNIATEIATEVDAESVEDLSTEDLSAADTNSSENLSESESTNDPLAQELQQQLADIALSDDEEELDPQLQATIELTQQEQANLFAEYDQLFAEIDDLDTPSSTATNSYAAN
ncbi:DNA recombination protein RmuC [Psittacicella hinzii]|uniref:DNA recombination protein RmuC n=1 Tax=Psittacicella hinzii TaxID=2028575 RepID=A0A3A1YIK6_9GAMM|nr:DNA recombination protein RmuC [Psittacicella hinzii]RIY37099.1 hypothetical protein CKF58_05405 [Psittacicella hinzii]